MTAPNRLPAALQKEAITQWEINDEPQFFCLPPNTAGMAKTIFDPQTVLQQPALPQPGPPQSAALLHRGLHQQLNPSPGVPPVIFISAPACQPMMVIVTLPAENTGTAAVRPSVPYTTQCYRKRNLAREEKGILVRKYEQKIIIMINTQYRDSHTFWCSPLQVSQFSWWFRTVLWSGRICGMESQSFLYDNPQVPSTK